MLIQRHAAFRLSTRHHAPRAVAATAKTFGITQAPNDERFRPHAAWNNPKLTFLRTHRPFARHPHILAVMVFAADVVVVATASTSAVNGVGNTSRIACKVRAIITSRLACAKSCAHAAYTDRSSVHPLP
jgi:hypothetical protein